MKSLPPYKFSPIFEVIISSSQHSNEIRKAFDEMVKYYVDNPDEFVDILLQTRDIIESSEHLSKSQLNALSQIEKVLDNNIPADKYFVFSEDLLLNDLKKIYKQIRDKHTIDVIRDNKSVDITFYSLVSSDEDAEFIVHNKLGVKKITLKAQDFMTQYQMLLN